MKLTWFSATPTTPGWYWYSDDITGPLPVCLGWDGRDHPDRALVVDITAGDDELLSLLASELEGIWIDIPEPPNPEDSR